MAKQGEGTRRPQENPTEHQSQWLLDFLDRNLRHFSKSVRDAIGITIALLLVTVVLHGTIAPTYVEGRLLVQSAENDPPSFGRSYRLIRGNENPVFVNDNAYWILPVRGFIPLSNEVLITDDSGSRVGTFTFHGRRSARAEHPEMSPDPPRRWWSCRRRCCCQGSATRRRRPGCAIPPPRW